MKDLTLAGPVVFSLCLFRLAVSQAKLCLVCFGAGAATEDDLLTYWHWNPLQLV